MKMKTSALEGAALDWAVCKAAHLFDAYPKKEGCSDRLYPIDAAKYLRPSIDWARGGPIVEDNKISVVIDDSGAYVAYIAYNYAARHMQSGPTPLIAAMRCYVSSKLGDEVDVPDTLGGKNVL